MAASSEIEKLERRYAENPDGRYFAPLADAYRKAGQVDRALEVVRAGLEKHPDYLSAHIVFGRCLLDKREDEGAGQAFERVLALDSENIIALKSLSEIAERRGQPFQARQWLQKLLQVDPMNADASADLERLGGAIASTPTAPMEALSAPVTPEQSAEISFADVALPGAPAEASPEAPPEAPPETPPEAPPELPPPTEVFAEPERTTEFIFDAPPEDAPPAALAESAVPGLVSVQFQPPPEEARAPAEEMKPFDESLAWGTGERSSRTISQGDIEAALHERNRIVPDPLQTMREMARATAESSPEAVGGSVTAPPGGDMLGGPVAAEPEPSAGGSEAAGSAPVAPVPETAGAAELDAASRRTEPVRLDAAPTEQARPEVWGTPVQDAGGEPVFLGSAAEAERAPSLSDLPIIMPEDVTPPEEMARPSGKFAHAPLETAPPPPAAPDTVPGAPELPPLVTETMGDLYLRQGFRSEAADVYRSVLAQRPGDAGLRAKLTAIEAPPPTLSAAALGGDSVRVWLRRLGAMRVGVAVPASAEEIPAGPSPLEEAFAAPEPPAEPAGEPTHPAGDAFTLDAIFGGQSRTSLTAPPEVAPPAPSPGTSFDEFFGAPAGQDSVRPDAGDTPAAPASDDDIGSFNAWLHGLKR